MTIDRESNRDFCMDFACPRLFHLDDCCKAACPRVWGVPEDDVQIFYLDSKGDAHFVASKPKELK